MLELKDFYFVRHGETDWNREHRGMGQKNIPLNANGIQQSQAAASLLTKEPIQLIYHSPLQRAKTTAEIIAEKIKIPLIEIQDLIECSWGVNEGAIKGKWTQDWLAGAEIPRAENFDHFYQRALSGINQALKNEGPVLIVSHGGIFWAVQKYCKLGSTVDLPNGVPLYLRAPINHNLPWSFTFLN